MKATISAFKKTVLSLVVSVTTFAVFAAAPTVSDETAKQRYPWNELVDITCKVSGINGTTNGLEFVASRVASYIQTDTGVKHVME